MMVGTDLVKIGFSQKEADIYLALLELGMSDAYFVAKKSGVNRTTTYLVLDGLVHKGIVSSLEKNGKQYYLAEHPERLVRYMEQKKTEVQNMFSAYSAMLPDLLALFNRHQGKPIVRYYEGIEAMQQLRMHILSMQSKELLGLLPLKLSMMVDNKTKEQTHGLREELAKKGILLKAIYCCAREDMAKLPTEQMEDIFQGVDYRLIPQDQLPVKNEINIFDDKLILSDVKQEKPFGVMIVNPEMAISFKTFFTLAWESAGKYDLRNK